jgi:hypothetical protein
LFGTAVGLPLTDVLMFWDVDARVVFSGAGLAQTVAIRALYGEWD